MEGYGVITINRLWRACVNGVHKKINTNIELNYMLL